MMTLKTELAYQAWQHACEAAMRRAMRHGAEHISDFNRRNDRIARLKLKYETLLAAEKGRPAPVR
jgi:hypothetical protein